MNMEGHNVCTLCQSTICSTCNFGTAESGWHCVKCYAESQFVNISDAENNLSKIEMVEKIGNRGYRISVTDSYEDVLDMYDMINKNEGIFGEDILNSVSIPEYSTNYLSTLVPITSFGFNKGGCFIHDEKLSISDVIQLMETFVELVNIKKVVVENRMDLTTTYSVVPSMILEMAKRSRAYGYGFRLLKRCVRHAMDSLAIDIRGAKVTVVKEDVMVSLIIEHSVRASMKQEIYDVVVCFNVNSILACQCSCKCGSQNVEKVMCIHMLPVLYQVSLLVFDGLGEHILIELASYVSSMSSSDMTDDNAARLQNVIKDLILAVKKSLPVLAENQSCWYTIKGLLSCYNVGTNQMKQAPKSPNDRSLLKPLRQLDRRSSLQSAKQHILMIHVQNDDEPIPFTQPDLLPRMSLTDYTNITLVCWEVCRQLRNKSDHRFLNNLVGFQVVALRSIQGKPFNKIVRSDVPSSTTRKVMELLNLANGIGVGCAKRTPVVCNKENEPNASYDTPVIANCSLTPDQVTDDIQDRNVPTVEVTTVKEVEKIQNE
jgi:hypothetical protein